MNGDRDDRLVELSRHTSIEVVPSGSERLDDLAEQLGACTRVYLTSVPGSDPKSLVDKAGSVLAAGLVPVPHIAARNLPDVRALDALVGSLAQAGVMDVLVVAGSAKNPAGDLDSSLAVLRSGVLERHGIRRVDVAGHPEGSPDIPADQVLSALRTKAQWAGERDVQMRIVSQFAFQAEAYLSWVSGLRRHGIELPIVLGLPGPAKTTTLVTYGLRCGVGPSLGMLRRQGGRMLRLAGGRFRPGPLIEQIAAAPVQDLGIVGLHFFPFGAVEQTVRLVLDARAGRLEP